MGHFENIVWQEFTIPNGTSVSNVIKLGGSSLVGIKIPADWVTTQDIVVQGAIEDPYAATEVTDFQRLHAQDGTLQKFSGALAPGTLYWIDPKATFGLKQIQLQSVNEGTDAAEVVAATRVGKIGLRPVD